MFFDLLPWQENHNAITVKKPAIIFFISTGIFASEPMTLPEIDHVSFLVEHAQTFFAGEDDTTFNSHWRDIRKSLVCRGGLQYRTAIDHLETECMDPETKQHYIELLEQWKRDEDNVKDQLEEVMKKLDKITTEGKLTSYQNISLCAKF